MFISPAANPCSYYNLVQKNSLRKSTFQSTTLAIWRTVNFCPHLHLAKSQFHQCLTSHSIYYNKRVLSLTHTPILNVCLTMSMHGLPSSTQHLDQTLEPLNWIRVCPSRPNEYSRKRSHVLYCDIRHLSHTCVLHFLYIHLALVLTLYWSKVICHSEF